MKSFKHFICQEYAPLESILYYDKGLFTRICQGKYNMTAEQIQKFDVQQNVINEDDERKYMQNDEEIQLIKTYQNDPDSKEGRQAMQKLVQNKMPLIYSKVNKHLITHPKQAPHRDDLVQEASLGLMKAIEKFDVNSKNIFNAFAIRYIVGAILNAFNPSRETSIVDGKVDQNGNVTSVDSIDQVVSGSRGQWADKDTTLGDSIPDENAKEPGQPDDDYEEQRKMLKDWIKQLPEKEAKAIELYFPESQDDKKTFEQIGKELGMTKMGVKKLIDRILEKLRSKAKDFKDGGLLKD